VAKCSEAEAVALGEAGPLLRFAAERVEDLDPDLSLAIAEALAANENDQWTPQVSQRFWAAFSKLCDLIQPVTMDCLAASHRNITSTRWFGRGAVKLISSGQRSSGRYFFVLFALLGVVLPAQLYVWTCTSLAKKIDDVVASIQTNMASTQQDAARLYAQVAAANPTGPPYKYTDDQNLAAENIQARGDALNYDVDRLLYETNLLEQTFKLVRFSGSKFPFAGALTGNWYERFNQVANRFVQVQAFSRNIQASAELLVGVVGSFLLPVLLGTTGAVAYVLRGTSEQIRTTTFSQTSPTRNLVRVALGALAGVVVGLFNGLSATLTLSPLALSFLAGYGVEALFSMFDGLISRFREGAARPATGGG
jgi:hypothetical protein